MMAYHHRLSVIYPRYLSNLIYYSPFLTAIQPDCPPGLLKRISHAFVLGFCILFALLGAFFHKIATWLATYHLQTFSQKVLF